MRGLILIVCLLVRGTKGFCQATLNETVFPYPSQAQNGNTADETFLFPTERQQWFRSSYLAQAWSNPVSITEVAFRVNEQVSRPFDYNATIPRVEIWVATSQRDAPNLSNDWLENSDVNRRMVFAADQASLTSPGGAGPNAFGLRFSFSTPFEYDPSRGHLIMLIRTTGNGEFFGANAIDAQGFGGSLATTPIATVGYLNQQDPALIGVVTEIRWISVPEPTAFSVILLFATIPLCRKALNG